MSKMCLCFRKDCIAKLESKKSRLKKKIEKLEKQSTNILYKIVAIDQKIMQLEIENKK